MDLDHVAEELRSLFPDYTILKAEVRGSDNIGLRAIGPNGNVHDLLWPSKVAFEQRRIDYAADHIRSHARFGSGSRVYFSATLPTIIWQHERTEVHLNPHSIEIHQDDEMIELDLASAKDLASVLARL